MCFSKKKAKKAKTKPAKGAILAARVEDGPENGNLGGNLSEAADMQLADCSLSDKQDRPKNGIYGNLDYNLLTHLMDRFSWQSKVTSDISDADDGSHRLASILVSFKTVEELVAVPVKNMQFGLQKELKSKIRQIEENTTKVSYHEYVSLFLQPGRRCSRRKQRVQLLRLLLESLTPSTGSK